MRESGGGQLRATPVKRRILVVDDEPDARQTFRDIFESEGYEVTEAATGEEAVGSINGYRPDVILLDIMLPGQTGMQVAQTLGARADTQHIPIVIITAASSFVIGDLGWGHPPSVRRYIFKPCRPCTLLQVVDDAIRHHD